MGSTEDLTGSRYMTSRLCRRIKNKLLFSGDGVTPPKWPVIGLMFLALFASAFTLTFLFPFLPEMILGFGYSEEEKGYYAGLVASSVFAGRAAGSYFWGWLSDRKGRKLVLLLTLGGSGVFSLLFGFTQNLAMAIAARFFTGLFSGILGTAKTVLYEVSDNTNQAVGMSMISLAWGAGIILGPATGGYLASPVVKYPETFSPGFFTRFPYIIPAMVTFFVNFAVLLVLAFKMKETLHSRDLLIQKNENEPLQDGHQVQNGCRCNDLRRHKSHSDVTESYRRTDMLTNDDSPCTNTNELSQNDKNLTSDTHKTNDNVNKNEAQNEASSARLYSSVPNMLYVPNGDSEAVSTERKCMCDMYNQRIDDTRTLKDGDWKRSFSSGHGFESESQKQSCQNSGICVAVRESALVTNMRQKDVRQSVILFTVFSFAIIGFEDVFNVWASTETRLDGLGFSTDKIGTVLSMVGIPLLLLLIFIFSTLERHFGIKKTYMICAFIMMVSVSACPVLHLLSDRPKVLWPVLLLILIPERLCASCCFSATALFINNSVTPDNAGAVNGIGMTFTAIARTLAPAMGGSVFAWAVSRGSGPPFDVSFAFFLFGVVFWLTILMCLVLPERLNRQKK